MIKIISENTVHVVLFLNTAVMETTTISSQFLKIHSAWAPAPDLALNTTEILSGLLTLPVWRQTKMYENKVTSEKLKVSNIGT